MSRYDLTDFEWRVIAPLLPNKPRGVPRVDDRRVLNGIFWVLRRAFALVEMNHVAVAIAENLNFDMAWRFDIAFK